MAPGIIGSIPVPLDADPVDLTGPTAADGDLGRMAAAVAAEQALTDVRLADLESRSGAAVAGSVATFADLPDDPADGQSWIVRDEVALYTWVEATQDWADPVPVQGAATDAAVSGLVGSKSTATRTTLDLAYFTTGDTPPPLPVVGQRWMDTSDDSLMVPSPTTQIGDRWLAGVVPPNGSVAAPVGTRYTDTAATAGAVEWIKATGSGNTGWVVAVGDTGVRDLSGLLATGWTSASKVYAHRIGNTVTLSVYGYARADAAASGNYTLLTLPQGVRPAIPSNISHWERTYRNGIAGVYGSGLVEGRPGSASVDYCYMTFTTRDAWPTTLPGTAA